MHWFSCEELKENGLLPTWEQVRGTIIGPWPKIEFAMEYGLCLLGSTKRDRRGWRESNIWCPWRWWIRCCIVQVCFPFNNSSPSISVSLSLSLSRYVPPSSTLRLFSMSSFSSPLFESISLCFYLCHCLFIQYLSPSPIPYLSLSRM